MKTLATFVTGGRLYGTSFPGSDYDYTRVTWSTPETLLGLERSKPKQTFKGDEDTVALTLNHVFAQLLKGAPNTFELLFATPLKTSEAWQAVLEQKHLFLNKRLYTTFLGMAKNNLRMADKSEAEGKPEKAWKQRMHTLRVLEQLVELATKGTMVFPRPLCSDYLELRSGKWPKRVFETVLKNTFATLEKLEAKSPWPENDSKESHQQRAQAQALLMSLNFHNLTTQEW